MCQAVKNIWAKFLEFSIFTQNLSFVEFPRAIFELGHNTVLMF